MWYVIQVYTGTETEVCRQCRGRIMEEDEDVFVLLAERMTRIRGEWRLVTGRLFPGYLFVETDRIQDFYMRLRQIGGMTKILSTDKELTPVYPDEQEYLAALGGKDHIVRYSQGYIRGEEMVVTSGALKECRGKVKKVLRHKRLVVLEVELMGRLMEVTVGMGIVSRQGGERVARMAGGREMDERPGNERKLCRDLREKEQRAGEITGS